MKLNYDKELNKEKIDPVEFYSKFEGVEYVDTIMVSSKDVYFNPNKQPRTENQNIGNVEKLIQSFRLRNFDHKFRPPAVDIEKINGIYDGSVGWNRTTVFSSLGVDIFPVDLLSYTSDYDKHKHRGISNNEEEHHNAAASMSQIAIKEEIKKSIKNGWLPKNPKGQVTDTTIKAEIVDYTTVIIDGFPAPTILEVDRKKMLKDIRASFPKNDKLQTYNKEIIDIAMATLGLPFGGYDSDTGKIGYVLTHTVNKDGLWNMLFANPKHKGIPVNITFAIPVPSDKKEITIEKRKLLKKSLEDVLDLFAVKCADIFDIKLEKARDKVSKLDIKVLGFLNSYVDEVVEVKSNYSLVDVDGNVVKIS